MANPRFVFQGACWCGLGVALGAFGAHGLKNLASAQMLQTFETGVRYLFYHGIALLLCGLLEQSQAHVGIRRAARFFTAGIVLFSGSLFLLVSCSVLGIAGWEKLGAITPLGGLAFLMGWAQLAWSQWAIRKSG